MKRATVILSALLVVGELLLIMASWLLSATMGDSVRSLLSPEGIRWMLGSFVDTIQTPVLVWLLLLAMAYGCLQGSGIFDRRNGSGQRSSAATVKAVRRLPSRLFSFTPALWGALLLLLLAVVIVAILVVVPPGVLLSATGSLWPSPFSRALLPLTALAIIIFATAYGILARSFTSFAAIIESLAHGVALAAPLFVVYVFLALFVASLHFSIAGS